MREVKRALRKTWKFIWEDDSPLSWIVNVLLAFVIIKFLVYPGLGLVLGTSHPLVAVVSGSMEHDVVFDRWWQANSAAYADLGITRDDFRDYPMKNGFNKGDIIVLTGVKYGEVKKGDIIVYRSGRPDPIIHRIIDIREENEKLVYTTKGDNNKAIIVEPDLDETMVTHDLVIGKASFRIPLLGYVKIISVAVWNSLTGGK